MEYRSLGSSGLKVSTVGLGTWLTFGSGLNQDQANATVLRAIELGINLFDTANEYSGGQAEEALGKALSAVPRSSYVVATKVYWPMGDGPNEWGLSRKHITEQAEASLRRLGTDYLDLYQCHRFDPQRPLAETCRAMNDLINAGKILYWGVSEWTAEQIRDTVLLCRDAGWPAPISNQPMYNPLWRAIERRILPVSDVLGLGTLAFSPLAMGVLTGKYTSATDLPQDSRGAGWAYAFFTEEDNWQDMPFFTQATLDAVGRLKPLAESLDASLAQLALAWCLHQPGVTSVLTGSSRLSQLEDNAAAADLQIPPETLDQITTTLADVATLDAPPIPNMES